MRIYDLDKSLQGLISSGEFQIELIGEDDVWTVKVSRRTSSDELQRYVYDELGSSASADFLDVYDFAAGIVSRERGKGAEISCRS